MLRRLLAGVAAALVPFAAAVADPIPSGWQASNVQPIGYSALGGRSGGFKMGVKRTGEGASERWHLYVGHLWHSGWSIVDVTDPANPRYVKFVEGPADTETKQVTLNGNLMITGLSPNGDESGRPASEIQGEGGVYLWDVSDPENPQRLSHWIAGPRLGVHRNSYPGGRYAYLSTRMPGYRNLVMTILDVSDPRVPRYVGVFAQPGQKEGDPPVENVRNLGFHGPVTVSPDGLRAVAGFAPQVVNLDLSDPANPKKIGGLTMVPPFVSGGGSSSVHTGYPLWDRNLIFASNEKHAENCEDEAVSFAGFVDNRDPTAPRLMSLFPTPRPPPGATYRDFCDKNGRFGPHNISMETHSPDVQKIGDLLHITWFNAGLRIFDIRNPRLVEEAGWFLPPTPTVRAGPRPEELESSMEDVLVDARGYAYVTDKQWGLWILKYTGPIPN